MARPLSAAPETPVQTPSPTKGIGSLMTSAFSRICSNCEEEVPANQCCPWGNKFSCHVCKTNYNRNNERMKGSPQLKTWWKKMSKDQRREWYRTNKETYEPGQARAWENAGEYEESTTQASSSKDEELVSRLTLDEWIIREKLLGNCGEGSQAEQRQVAIKSFVAQVMDKNVHTPFVNGQYLVPVFRGTESRVGTEQRREEGFKRRKVIRDTVDYDAAAELKRLSEESNASWLSQHSRVASESCVASSSEAPSIPEGMARLPAIHEVPKDEMQQDVKREVLMALQREAKIMQLEEVDDHHAAQASKIDKTAKAERGRPRKLASELMSDAARIIRDRAQKIEDTVADLRKQYEDVHDEAKKQLRPLPEDIKAIAASAKADLQTQIDVMGLAKEGLQKTDIKSLVEKDGQQVSAQQLQKAIGDLTSQVFKTNLVSANKAISSLRKGIKRALKKNSRKKGKAAAAQDEGIPNFVIKAAEYMDANSMVEHHNVDEMDLDRDIDFDLKAAFFTRAPKAVADGLDKIKAVGAQAKWLRGHIEKNKDGLTTAMAAFKPAVANQVCKILQDHVANRTTTSIALPSDCATLKDEIFNPQAWAQAERHLHVGVTAYGIPEVRLLRAGCYCAFAVKIEHVRGDTLRQKLDHVLTIEGTKQFIERATTGENGFWFEHDEPNTMIGIPSGYIVTTIGKHSSEADARGCEGIRWGLLASTQRPACQRAVDAIATILKTYPDLGMDGEYNSFKTCLEKYLIPQAVPP